MINWNLRTLYIFHKKTVTLKLAFFGEASREITALLFYAFPCQSPSLHNIKILGTRNQNDTLIGVIVLTGKKYWGKIATRYVCIWNRSRIKCTFVTELPFQVPRITKRFEFFLRKYISCIHNVSECLYSVGSNMKCPTPGCFTLRREEIQICSLKLSMTDAKERQTTIMTNNDW